MIRRSFNTADNSSTIIKLNLRGCEKINWDDIPLKNLSNSGELDLSDTDITETDLTRIMFYTPS